MKRRDLFRLLLAAIPIPFLKGKGVEEAAAAVCNATKRAKPASASIWAKMADGNWEELKFVEGKLAPTGKVLRINS